MRTTQSAAVPDCRACFRPGSERAPARIPLAVARERSAYFRSLLRSPLGGGFLLRLFGPGRGYAVHASVGDGLAEVLMIMRHEDVDDVAIVGVGAEFLFRFGEIGIGHFLHGSDGESERLIKLIDNLGLVGSGSFKTVFLVSGCSSGSRHHRGNTVIRPGNMQKQFAD